MSFATSQKDHVEYIASENRTRASGPVFEGDTLDAVRLAVAGWRRATRMMHAICKERSIPLLCVLQPNQHAPDSKVRTDEEVERSNAPAEWIEAARIAYPLLRDDGQRLADHGVHFLDASNVFRDVEETVYIDFGHLTASGHEILAETIAPAFLAMHPSE